VVARRPAASPSPVTADDEGRRGSHGFRPGDRDRRIRPRDRA